MENGIDLNLVWGAEAIATVIGRNRRQVFAMLEAGQIPARKVGGRWVADRQRLAAFFSDIPVETTAGR